MTLVPEEPRSFAKRDRISELIEKFDDHEGADEARFKQHDNAIVLLQTKVDNIWNDLWARIRKRVWRVVAGAIVIMFTAWFTIFMQNYYLHQSTTEHVDQASQEIQQTVVHHPGSTQ